MEANQEPGVRIDKCREKAAAHDCALCPHPWCRQEDKGALTTKHKVRFGGTGILAVATSVFWRHDHLQTSPVKYIKQVNYGGGRGRPLQVSKNRKNG